jgi:hypothetical protein
LLIKTKLHNSSTPTPTYTYPSESSHQLFTHIIWI